MATTDLQTLYEFGDIKGRKQVYTESFYFGGVRDKGLRELYGSAILNHEARRRLQNVFIATLLINTVSATQEIT